MDVQRTFSGAPWERHVGYCRAIRAGDLMCITGTASVADDGSVHAPGDAYEQAKQCLRIIQRAIADVAGGRETLILRTRMFVTDITQWEAFGRAHREFFGDKQPATTMVEVRSLIDPAMLIEIEADAIRV